jgi:5-formyltetrahydrofolate cyclo-ligase
MDKETIREEMRTRRSEISQEERKIAGRAISENLVQSSKINLLLTCWRFSVYLSTSQEIPTRYIMREFWSASRDVCVPTWDPAAETYMLCAFAPGVSVIKGPLGIREPVDHFPVPAWDVDAFIIPGLAFDMYGARLGFGAGYYDRILAGAHKSAKFIAICHDWQVIEDEQIPQEPHDIRMHWIVTEKRVIKCGVPPTRRSAPAAVDN